jgi:DNA polymerase sigma
VCESSRRVAELMSRRANMDSDMDTNSDEQSLLPEEKQDHFLAFGAELQEDEEGDVARPPVWLHPDDMKDDRPAVRAHNEICRFCDLIAPTQAELRAAKAAEDFSRSMVERVLGTGPELHVFGSRATGLVLPQSDLDMCLLSAPSNALDQLARELRR